MLFRKEMTSSSESSETKSDPDSGQYMRVRFTPEPKLVKPAATAAENLASTAPSPLMGRYGSNHMAAGMTAINAKFKTENPLDQHILSNLYM